ncbi:excinuclease ABC subunit UvrC [Candidatus Saccharibacteria bacterium]|nr:excinuclease ABC subunit UvrC [Candidatus Saccharibacteria bacterium]
MNAPLQEKLKTLPAEPGVYFHKNTKGEIIYIGKAAVLKNRVRQYFQKSRLRDPKTDALVAEIADTDWVTVDSEIDALFLEAEMIRRYLPPYNILLRDDKSLSYVRIDINSNQPTVTMVRRPLDDGAKYFGPYLNSFAVKKSLRLLRRIFPFATKDSEATMGSKLYEQMGLDPGVNSGKTSINTYRNSLRQLMKYLSGEKQAIINEIEKKMKRAAKSQAFEEAARLRNQLLNLRGLKKQIIFSDREFMDLSKDLGLQELSDLLGLEKIPKRIEGYDISHMQGSDTVSSMVVFESGMPAKDEYRKFKMRIAGNDDFVHMYETAVRRLSEKNIKAWGLPDLFLIDGGKGQLAAFQKAMKEKGINRPSIGLAKQYEQIVISEESLVARRDQIKESSKKLKATLSETDEFLLVELPDQSHAIKLLQRIRDESHRFAVSYHSVLKGKRQTKSWLDEVPGIGPATKRLLIRSFGSARGVKLASSSEISKVIGPAKSEFLAKFLSENS